MAPRNQSLEGKTIFVVGGSAGLGKEMSKVMAARGANITIFARNEKRLQEAKAEITITRKNEDQTINIVAVDMSDPLSVRKALDSQSQIPDSLFCFAGGTAAELGFLVDLEPADFQRVMNNNYYSSLYPSQAVLQQWIKDDEGTTKTPKTPKSRKIVFVNSSASLVPVPGYVAYTAAKCAQRGLADTLRLEALRYCGPKSTYAVQCIFAHNFITDTFIEEQKRKPALTKRLEGTTGSIAELEKTGKFPHAANIAAETLDAVDRGDFAVTDGRFEPQMCWATSIGSSPKRGWGILDSMFAFIMALVFPFLRWDMERECRGDAYKKT